MPASPPTTYLLRREFEEQGTKIRALNDRGDDSLEGELTDGILDQLAKFERAKTAERTRRGKIRRAREGKVVPTHTPDYGFGFNDSRDNYVVAELEMAVVRRIFRMIGVEGMSMHAVKKTFEREGIPAPGGGARWDRTFFRACVLDDVYKPHSFAEIKELVLPEVAARLDPNAEYGVWWFNRRRRRRTHVSERGPNGRSYRWRSATVIRPQDEWVAVPVPDCGIPREWVNAAREAVKYNRRPSSNGERFWELSGEILVCGGCGHVMATHAVYGSGSKSRRRLFYYRCNLRKNEGVDACEQAKNYRAGEIESRVWEAGSGILKDPEQLRADLERMIELKREGRRGDPKLEAKGWLDKLSEVDHKSSGFQDIAAEGLITFDELRAKLAALDATRATAERELDAIKVRRDYLESLERDKKVLLDTYASLAPEALESLTPEERQRLYKMLRLRAVVNLDGSIEAGGTFVDSLEVCTVEVSS